MGQSVLHLNTIFTDNPALQKKITYKKTANTLQERNAEVKRIFNLLYENAYLSAKNDTNVVSGDTLRVFISCGKQYKWAQLKNLNVDEAILSSINFREKLYRAKPLNYKAVATLMEKMIVYCENNGYPFASVKLDSIVFIDEGIKAGINLNKGNKIKIDSVVIGGTAKINKAYLSSYIGVKPGMLYNEQRVRAVSGRLKELPFLTERQSAAIIFTEKETKLLLNIDKKKASQFDGIIGVLPDNVTGNILITGDVKLKLQNAFFYHGELIDINWRSLKAQTQDLKARFIYPFLFSTPLGLDYDLKIYKLDTTFIDVYNNVGMQFALTGNNFFKVFIQNKSSNLLSTKGLEFATTLPVYADVSTLLYGAGARFEKLDYRFNPRKGFTVNVNASIGNKDVKKNAKLNPVAYNNVVLSSVQYTGDFNGAVYIPVGNRSTFKIGINAALIQGESLFQNELFRIGGLKILRGFDEESIRASAFAVSTLEYRFILEQNSYLHVFYDWAYYENNSSGMRVSDTPMSFGAGVSFETKAGIFSLNYALGKQFNNPIDLRAGKIHFGVVNYF